MTEQTIPVTEHNHIDPSLKDLPITLKNLPRLMVLLLSPVKCLDGSNSTSKSKPSALQTFSAVCPATGMPLKILYTVLIWTLFIPAMYSFDTPSSFSASLNSSVAKNDTPRRFKSFPSSA